MRETRHRYLVTFIAADVHKLLGFQMGALTQRGNSATRVRRGHSLRSSSRNRLNDPEQSGISTFLAIRGLLLSDYIRMRLTRSDPAYVASINPDREFSQINQDIDYTALFLRSRRDDSGSEPLPIRWMVQGMLPV